MKLLTFVVLSLAFVSNAMAYTAVGVDATESEASGVVTNGTDPAENDHEATNLYNAMTTAAVETNPGRFMKGPVYSPDRDFVLQCVDEEHFIKCVFEIRKGPHSEISFSRVYGSYKISGEDAASFGHQFRTNSGSVFKFESINGRLSIVSSPASFSVVMQR